MAYERRKGRFYYYRKVWRDGTCRSEYIGPPGERALLFSSLDKLDRERRQQEAAERQIARAAFAELAAPPPALVEVLAEAQRATADALQAAGYHQHKRGEWRKRRGHKDEDQDQGPSA